MTRQATLSTVAAILVAGCAARVVNVDRSDQPPGAALAANVGELFFSHELMTGEDNLFGVVFYGDAIRTELTITTATPDRIVLEYAEYTKPPGPKGGYERNGAWMRRTAFDRLLEFDIKASSTIRFKRYEFTVVGVEGGRVAYKRVR